MAAEGLKGCSCLEKDTKFSIMYALEQVIEHEKKEVARWEAKEPPPWGEYFALGYHKGMLRNFEDLWRAVKKTPLCPGGETAT